MQQVKYHTLNVMLAYFERVNVRKKEIDYILKNLTKNRCYRVIKESESDEEVVQ